MMRTGQMHCKQPQSMRAKWSWYNYYYWRRRDWEVCKIQILLQKHWCKALYSCCNINGQKNWMSQCFSWFDPSQHSQPTNFNIQPSAYVTCVEELLWHGSQDVVYLSLPPSLLPRTWEVCKFLPATRKKDHTNTNQSHTKKILGMQSNPDGKEKGTHKLSLKDKLHSKNKY